MKIKRFLAILLATTTLFSLAACGEKKEDETFVEVGGDVIEEVIDTPETEGADAEDVEATPDAVKPSEKPSVNKPTPTPEQKPSAPTTAPSEAPAQTPESTPTATPTPEQKPKTVGKTLLDVFNAKASATSSTAEIADAILATPIIQFPGATMPVEPGLLSGFGNAEITGFSEGTMFGPMIGSIAFIGYVFNLEEGTNKADFISTLKSNADLRWNICVEADEMVVGSSGNKVFFVMCPKQFSE